MDKVHFSEYIMSIMPKPKSGAFSRSFVLLIKSRLRDLRLSIHAAEKHYGFPPETLRSVIRGSAPSVDRAKQICDALGIGISFSLSERARESSFSDETIARAYEFSNGAAKGISKEISKGISKGISKEIPSEISKGITKSISKSISAGITKGGITKGIHKGGKYSDIISSDKSFRVLRHQVRESHDFPILGIVRAGAEIEYWNDQFPGSELVSVPGEIFNESSGTRWGGVVVRGDSMCPIFDDGDVLFFDLNFSESYSALLGKACVVETSSGGAMVKRVERGRRDGYYNLESYNRLHSVISDVTLRTARPVRWIKKA